MKGYNTFATIASRNTITIDNQDYAMILGMAQTRRCRNEVGIIFEDGKRFSLPAWEVTPGKTAGMVLQQFCDGYTKYHYEKTEQIRCSGFDDEDWEVMNRIQYEFPAFFNEETPYRSEAADKRYVCRFVPVEKKAVCSILWDQMDCWNC